MLKLKKEIKFFAELAEGLCILMNLFSSTLKQKQRRLKEEMYLRDFKTKWPFRALQHTNPSLHGNRAQSDLLKEVNHL